MTIAHIGTYVRMRTFTSIYAPRYPDYSNMNVAVVLCYISKDDTRKLLCFELHLKHKHAFFQNKILFDDVIRDSNSRRHLWIAMLFVHNRIIKSTGFPKLVTDRIFIWKMLKDNWTVCACSTVLNMIRNENVWVCS